MIKKIILGIFSIIMFLLFTQVSADPFAPAPIDSSLDGSNAYQEQQADKKAAEDKAKSDKIAADKAAAEKAKADRIAECANSKSCLDQETFTIGIKDTIGMGFAVKSNTSETINYALGTVIQKLMIALGVLAVLIMTVGAGYIIMYHGQDELLSKGKSIFMSGITALVVALSSYYLVSILRYILYN